VLKGHDKGVNWVCFHPTENIIVSSSDDRRIVLWRFINLELAERGGEDLLLKGHTHNVSCVVFNPITGHLISNS
jgi:coatomer protein complex subunit alpha (xenin)